MKNAQYKLLSNDCSGTCPAVLEDGNDIVVIGTLLTEQEEAKMIKEAKVGVASYERTVRIPRQVFEAAVDKFLTAKA